MKKFIFGLLILIALMAGSVMAGRHSALRYGCNDSLPPTCNWVLDYCDPAEEVPPGQIPCQTCYYYCEEDPTITAQIRRPAY